MSLYLLLIIEIGFLLLSLCIFKGDYIAPPVITCVMIFIGTCAVIPSVELWNVKIKNFLLIVYIIGYCTIIFSSLVAKKILKVRFRTMLKQFTPQMNVIHCKQSMEIIFLFGSILLTLLYLYDAIRVGTINGGRGFGAIAYMKAGYTIEGMVKMNLIIRQGFKIVMLFTYISTFLVGHNCIVLNEGVKKNFAYIVSIVCGCAITIFSGSRTDVLRIISALLFCSSFSIREKNGWRTKENRKFFRKIIIKLLPIICVAIVIAFTSRVIVKTTGTATSSINSMVGYLSYYIGSPVQVLNVKLDYFQNINELFFGTNSTFPNFVYLGHLNYGGNAQGLFGSVVPCNGLIRMFLYLFIMYFVGTYLYYKLYGTYSSKKRNKYLILYAYAYFVFTLSFYADGVPMLLLPSNFSVILAIFVLYKLIMYSGLKI